MDKFSLGNFLKPSWWFWKAKLFYNHGKSVTDCSYFLIKLQFYMIDIWFIFIEKWGRLSEAKKPIIRDVLGHVISIWHLKIKYGEGSGNIIYNVFITYRYKD